MPITDPILKQIAQKRRLHFMICRDCGSKNPIKATKCRRCHGKDLRPKKREIQTKK
ncbi:MAG: 50S ribosomal protein L40e [Thermoproteota archaeon]